LWEHGFSYILPHTSLMLQDRMQGNNQTQLGIILLNWNAAEHTARYVKSLREWHRLTFCVYVVDNGSTQGTLQFEENGDIPVCLLKSPINRGYAGGNNIGIRKAIEEGCEYILLLNNDAFISEENVELLLNKLQKNADIGCIGPSIHEGDHVFLGGRDIGIYPIPRNISSHAMKKEEIIYVDYVPGMAFLTRREVIERIGFLDEQFFFSGEIADFCRRAVKEGFQCAICPKIRADHVLESDNPYRNTLYQYYSLRNRFLFVRKHHAKLRWILEPFWVLVGIRMYIRMIRMWQKKESMAYRMAIVDGMRGVFGDRNDLFHCDG